MAEMSDEFDAQLLRELSLAYAEQDAIYARVTAHNAASVDSVETIEVPTSPETTKTVLLIDGEMSNDRIH